MCLRRDIGVVVITREGSNELLRRSRFLDDTSKVLLILFVFPIELIYEQAPHRLFAELRREEVGCHGGDHDKRTSAGEVAHVDPVYNFLEPYNSPYFSCENSIRVKYWFRLGTR